MNLPTDPSLPLTIMCVYSLFFAGLFATFLWTPYLIIRYINLTLFINYNNKKIKYLSKQKAWLLTILCLPITIFSTIFFCEYFGDSSFLGFFMLLGILSMSPFMGFFLYPKVKKLEYEFEQTNFDD